jgi:hypothetical protein
MAPSQLLPVLATPKIQMKCSGGIPPMVVWLSPAARRALSREISRSLEASCSCRRFGGLPSTSAEPGTSPRMIPTSNLKYALTSLATSNTARCCKFGIRYLPRVRARISALYFSVFVHIPYTTQSGSSQPGRPRRTCGADTILPFASAVGKLARRSAPEDVQGRSRNLWFAVHHAFRIHGYRTVHIFIGLRGRVSAAHG